MDGTALLYVLGAGLFLVVQYAIIKAAVYHGLARFLREASRESVMRDSYDVPRRIDRLTAHLAEIARRRPPSTDPEPKPPAE